MVILVGVRRSAFGARRSAFGARRSAFGVRRSAFGARRSAFGARRSCSGLRAVGRGLQAAPTRPGLKPRAHILLFPMTKPKAQSPKKPRQYPTSSRAARSISASPGRKNVLERRRVRHRRIERADDAHRRVERLERFLLDDRGEALADAAGARVLVDDQHAAAVPRDGQHGARSSGASVRRSSTLASMPSAARRSATRSAAWT